MLPFELVSRVVWIQIGLVRCLLMVVLDRCFLIMSWIVARLAQLPCPSCSHLVLHLFLARSGAGVCG